MFLHGRTESVEAPGGAAKSQDPADGTYPANGLQLAASLPAGTDDSGGFRVLTGHPAGRHPAGGAGAFLSQKVGFHHANQGAAFGFVEPEIELEPSPKDRVGLGTHVPESGQGSRHQVQRTLRKVQPASGNIFGLSRSEVVEGRFDRFQGNGHGEELLDVGFGQVEHWGYLIRESKPVTRLLSDDNIDK